MDCRWEWRNLKHSVTNRSERSPNPLLMRHLMSRRIHYRYINLFFDLFEVAFPDWHQILHNHTLYQTLVLFLMAKTFADNLSQGFRTELPLTYRLLSPRPSLPISFPCWPPPCFFFSTTSLLLSPYTPRRSKKTVLVQVLLFCLRVEINWAPKTNPAITFK